MEPGRRAAKGNSNKGGPRPAMQQQRVKDAIERSALYAAGSGEVPAPPPLPAFVTNPADGTKYHRVTGIKPVESIGVAIAADRPSCESDRQESDRQLGSSCPPDIEHKDPSSRLLGALRSRPAPPPPSSTHNAKDLTKTVKQLLNID